MKKTEENTFKGFVKEHDGWYTNTLMNLPACEKQHKRRKGDSLFFPIITRETHLEEVAEIKRKLLEDVFGRIRNILFDKHYHKQIYIRFKISGEELDDLERFLLKNGVG